MATLDVLLYHRLSDVELLVSNALREFSSFIDNTRVQGSTTPPSETGGRGFDDAYLSLSSRVQRRFQLAKSFTGGPILMPGSKGDGGGMENGSLDHSPGTENENETGPDGMENVKMTPETYTSYCKGVLREIHSHSRGIDLNEESVESYAVGGLSWKAGELPKRLRSKNLLNQFGESSAADKSRTDDSQREPKTIYITLKGFYTSLANSNLEQ